MVPEAREPTFPKLTPEIVGTRSGDLIRRCPGYPSSPVPPAPEAELAVAVALSGGGFRATLASLGILRFLADAGLLSQVRYVSSVSGGSIASGILAAQYPKLAADGFTGKAFARLVQHPVVDLVSGRSLTHTMLRRSWKLIGPKTRTMLLADTFDDWFFHGLRLHDLPQPCRYIFNAANLTTGVRFGFEREWLGDYVLGRLPSRSFDLRVADAVAVSAAVPGLLAAFTPKGPSFPCENGRTPKLVDGGAYENTGLEPVDDLPDAFLIALNAGGIFRTGPLGRAPIVRDLQRSNSLLYRQSTSLRMLAMVDRFQLREDATKAQRPVPPEGRWGVLFGLATTATPGADWTAPPLPIERQMELAMLRTSFAKFERRDCRDLIYHAWWLTGATISNFHAGLLERYPIWEDGA